MTRLKSSVFYIILYAVYVFPAQWANAQEFKFRHLTVDDGLPTNFCWSVMKDSRGYIWITSRAGLSRYDGYNVKVFQYDPEDTNSLSDNRIAYARCMAEDTEGNLWVGTYKGLNRYDHVTESFKRYQHDPSNPNSISSDRIMCLYIDTSGTLWVGTGANAGLNKYRPETNDFTCYTQNPGTSDWQISSIYSIYEDRFGILWVGTMGGIYQFDQDRTTFSEIKYSPRFPDKSNPVIFKFITEDEEGMLVVGTQYGFITFDRSSGKFSPLEMLYDESIDVRWLDILSYPFDKEYTHLIIYDFDLYRYHQDLKILSQVPQDLADPSSLSGEALKSIYRDESGILWFPGERGVNILDPLENQILGYRNHPQELHKASSFLQDEKGGYWFGSDRLIHCAPNMDLLNVYDDFPVDKGKEKYTSSIWSLFEDSHKNIWIGTDKNGLYLLRDGTSEIIRCHLLPREPIFIYDIFEDSHGILWIGTDGGLFYRKPGEFPLTDFYQDSLWGMLNKTTILGITEDRTGNLWIGTTSHGLFCQPPEFRGSSQFHHYIHTMDDRKSISNDWVWSIYQDIRENLWIATEDGINRYNPAGDNFDRHYFQTRPSSNFIYDLTGDDHGFLYLTTENGLIRLNPADLDKEKSTIIKSRQILNYDKIFFYRIYRDRSGRIFIGTAANSDKEYYCFHPDSLTENQRIPPISITDFRVRNESFLLDSNVTVKKQLILKYNQNFFSFEFAALNYSQPEKNQYAYFLEGLEEEWIYSGTNRSANYTGVPPGHYIFHAKGSNNDGYWNDEGVSIAVTILPPPWKTWWAYMGYGVIFMALITLWRIYDLRRVRLKQKLELEHLEAGKLKELDSMKSRFFANISHEFRTPLTLILGPIEKIKESVSDELHQDIQIMQRNANRLLRLIDQLLTLSKLESGQLKLQARDENIVTLVNGYVQSFESLAKQMKIDLVFNSPLKELIVYVDQEKLEKILYNLLSNAFKFTPSGGRVAVTVRQVPPLVPPLLAGGDERGGTDEAFVQLSISDTGPGIAPDHLSRIFDRYYQVEECSGNHREGTGIGLALAKELVELHHGEIRVESEVGKGTTFFVLLPLGKEHLREEELQYHPERSKGQQSAPTLEGVSKVEYTPLVSQCISVSPLWNSVKRIITQLVTLRHTEETQRYAENFELAKLLLMHPHKGGGERGEVPHLLIVEDNPDLRSYMRGYLDESFNVIEAENGREGFEKALEQVPDLVISDVMMPVMDGMELCGRLKKDERTSHIPVILLTAKAGSESRIEGLQTGADDFITKPFDARELIVRIENLIRQRRELMILLKRELEIKGSMAAANVLTMDQQFIRKAIKVVEDNLSVTDFTSEDFARKMAMSRVQLHRKLKALVDQPASGFIRTLRLNKAAELLANNAGSVKEIAFDVGFNTLPYFTKCFREQFGVNPSDYKTIRKK